MQKTLKKLVFFLEERSCEEFLKSLLPRLLKNDIRTEFHSFQGKSDLDKSIMKRLRGYQVPEHEQVAFVIIRDQDSANCVEIKQFLQKQVQLSGRDNVLIRIACRELESFYLGDVGALSTVFPRLTLKKKDKDPDQRGSPSKRLLELTRNEYQKLSGSRRLGQEMSLEVGANTSQSFRSLITGIQNLIKSKLA